MKQKILRLSQRYVTALGIHLKDGCGTTLQSALRLGCQAAALGVAILDLARMHERAIVTLQLSDDKNGISKRAEIFFHEALTPIVEKHQGAWQSKSDLNRLDDTMYQRTR